MTDRVPSPAPEEVAEESPIAVSVVVPCYNEAANLRRGVLREMREHLAARSFTYEVVISDDGSTDDSRSIVREQIADWPEFRLLENAHGGKAVAVWHGIRAAQGQIILFTDMDQSTPLHQIDRLLPHFDAGYDVVIGSRGMARQDFPLYRRLGSAVFATFRRLLLLRSVSDTQCGFKAMRTPVAQTLFPRVSEIQREGTVRGRRVTAFDVELLYLAERAGYRIREVTVDWCNRDVVKGRVSNYLSESLDMARQVVRIKWKEIRGDYKGLR